MTKDIDNTLRGADVSNSTKGFDRDDLNRGYGDATPTPENPDHWENYFDVGPEVKTGYIDRPKWKGDIERS